MPDHGHISQWPHSSPHANRYCQDYHPPPLSHLYPLLVSNPIGPRRQTRNVLLSLCSSLFIPKLKLPLSSGYGNSMAALLVSSHCPSKVWGVNTSKTGGSILMWTTCYIFLGVKGERKKRELKWQPGYRLLGLNICLSIRSSLNTLVARTLLSDSWIFMAGLAHQFM